MVEAGIGPTKTQAKLANYATKKWPATAAWLTCARRQDRIPDGPYSDRISVDIGRQLTAKLKSQGIKTVVELVQYHPMQRVCDDAMAL